ncbi:MAG: hypothetical protein HYZ36_06185, partial [Pedosphaera parvula]|nr:hypothetical protein [Pedosphaera parvula]
WMGENVLNFDPGNRSNWDVSYDIEKSPLWPYCGKAPGIFKCPADKSRVKPNSGPYKGTSVARVRSMSMHAWVGGNNGVHTWFGGKEWRMYLKTTDMVDPGPSMTWILLDEREDSINDGFFVVWMPGYPDPKTTVMVDFPASYHNNAAGFAFADGHSEIHRWLDARTVPKVKKGQPLPLNVPHPNSRDVIWMQDRTTRMVR